MDQVRPRRRVLERVGGVGVEEPAAVGAEHLDRLLRGDRSARDRLRRSGEGVRVDEAVQVLDDAAGQQDHRGHDRHRQQQPTEAAREVDPEVADRALPAPREAAHERDGDRDADGGGDEVLHGEAGELHEVAHGRLGRVRLPVGVGDEGCRGVERQALRHGREPERSGQEGLQALQRVDEEHAHEREGEHAAGVGLPGLFAARVDADETVDDPLCGGILLAREDAEHEVADGAVQQSEQQDEGGDLEHAEPDVCGIDAHQKRSGFTRATTR